MNKRMILLIIGCTLLPGILFAQATKGCPQQGVVLPSFNAKNFPDPTTINNRYFPLVPGTKFVYESTQGPSEHVEVVVTNFTRKILKIDTVVVRDTVRSRGEIVEDTFDYFAEDQDGNVWYMGEDTKQFENGVLVGTEGSWIAGVDGAKPGFIMEAQPLVGDAYRQESSPGVAEDTAQVRNLNGSATVPYGSWQGTVLITSECTPLEPKVVEDKYYASGVGLVKTTTTRGGGGESVLVAVTR